MNRVRKWKLKQRLANPSRYYGDGGTIHSTGHLDIETQDGQVMAVWFRCQMLPFRVVERPGTWAEPEPNPCVLTGVEVRDPR